ncbi:Cytosolic carboxypeptidase 6 [Cichlidogyrus casuarinus]|uniref:Cytosolic carboxypeptidase 6 n=1 Tax=Cichlidogyrus casuarinus TaxID=1844966 RepID=A0ABD2Q0Q9_9PLAT
MSDSDQSDEEGHLAGNLNKYAAYPIEKLLKEEGPPPKGVLVFDAGFESGNLGRVDCINEFEYDLFIRPDTCNVKFRVWFNFIVNNAKRGQQVIFNLVNSSKSKSLYREGMSPVVRSKSRPIWTRIPSKNVFYYKCPEHRKNYVLSFLFCFGPEEEQFQFAYCFPYTYSRLSNYLAGLQSKNLPFFSRDTLGKSVQERNLDILTITHPKNLLKKQQSKRRVIFVTSRVHPGETPSSFVCEGFIDFLVSSHPLAQQLRYHIIFKIVPMLNPDGVYLGNYRCSLMGFDLNRHWHDPSAWAHPTITACKELLMCYDRSPEINLDFYVDIHAHSTLMNGFIYGNVYEDEERHIRQAVFPQLFSQNAEDFSLQQTNFNRDVIKAGTGRRTLGGLLEEKSLCYTLEVSFYGYKNPTTGEQVAYTEENARLGRNLAKTFHEYYRRREEINCELNTEIFGLCKSFYHEERRSVRLKTQMKKLEFDQKSVNSSRSSAEESDGEETNKVVNVVVEKETI